MPSVIKVLADVVSYRLRKLEMANLAGAVAIMLVLRLPLDDLLLRGLCAGLLNVLVYLNNDYMDVALDVRSAHRDHDKTSYLHEHMGAARAAQLMLALLLLGLGAVGGAGLLIALCAGGGACFAYSAYLKRRPYVDVAAMTFWGLAMPAVAFPLDSALGWALALQLGLFSSAFESIQVIRDEAHDRELGLTTTGVALGPRRTLLLARSLLVVCALYAAAVLLPLAGLLMALAPLLPLRHGDTVAYWNRIKAICGLAWLAICTRAYLLQASSGILLAPTVNDTVSWLALLR